MVETITDKKDIQLVVFKLGKEEYGIEINKVIEIIRLSEMTVIPRALDFIEGVINLRGKIIPVVDLKKRFGLTDGELTTDARIIVVDIKGQMVGVRVDLASEVLKIPVSSIEASFDMVTHIDEKDCLAGVGKLNDRLIILIDSDRILTKQERVALDEGKEE
ncbi:MAG: purine-binding chemotaxis protein CheW [Actinobacteria bacterium]|nr:purine-binding chemotaxis protein CheW [Actinomycetota bacterium]